MAKQIFKYSVGCDISKDTFNVCILEVDQEMKSKNDKIDAQGLAHMGAQQKHKPWRPHSKSIYILRALTRQHESVTKLKTSLQNKLHANEYSAVRNAIVKKQLNATIKLLEKQLTELAGEISKLID